MASGQPTTARPAARTAAERPATALPIAFGASALLLAAGGLVARFHPSTTPTVATPAPVATVPRVEFVGPSQQTLVVGSPPEVATALRSAGLAPDVADGAAQEVGSVLGHEPGDVRLVVDLAGPDNAREMTRLEATRARSGVVLTARPDGSYSSEAVRARLTTGM